MKGAVDFFIAGGVKGLLLQEFTRGCFYAATNRMCLFSVMRSDFSVLQPSNYQVFAFTRNDTRVSCDLAQRNFKLTRCVVDLNVIQLFAPAATLAKSVTKDPIDLFTLSLAPPRWWQCLPTPFQRIYYSHFRLWITNPLIYACIQLFINPFFH